MASTGRRTRPKRAGAMLAVLVMLAASLFPSGVPVSADILSWSAEIIPDATGKMVVSGTDVSDFAIAADSTTVYATDKESDKLYRSTDAGVTWTELTNPTGATEPQLVAVAPDNADIVAIVADDNEVYTTTNGGTSWDSRGIPQETGGGAAATNLYDITISTASGTPSVNYIAVAGIESGPLANVWYYDLGGASPAWKETNDLAGFSATSLNWTSTAAAVAFSPNFASDKVMVAVTEEDDGSTGTDNVSFEVFLMNQQAWNAASGPFFNYPVTIVSDDGITGLDSASISLSPDYLGSDDSMRNVFVGLTVAGDANAQATSGIYRLNDDNVTALKTGKQIHSVAYDGTNLVAGEYNTTTVRRSANPMATTPTVNTTSALKRPGGDNKVVVDWAGSDVMAGTSGDESAFAVSKNNGRSFNDISLIDTALTTLEDVAVSADGSKVYLATDDGTDLSLWRRASSWERVLSVQDNIGFIIRLAPEDIDMVYVAKKGASTIYYTTTAGDTSWFSRVSRYNVLDLVVESANVSYVASFNTTVSKSINSGFTWGSAEYTGLVSGSIHMIASIGVDKLIVGSDQGYVAYSTDGNSSWTSISQQIESSALLTQVTASGLASGDYIYAASSKADTKVVRWQIGTSTAWEDMAAPTSSGYGAYGRVLHDGVLYVANSDATANSEVLRTVNPTGSTVAWSTLASPGETFICTPSALKVSDGSAKLWVIDTTGAALFSYTDAVPDIMVSPSSIDFGSIDVGSSSANWTVFVSNNGTANLNISDNISLIGPSADQFLVVSDNCSGQTLAPSYNASLELAFSPTSSSNKTATLSIPSNDPDENPFNVTLYGMGTTAPTPHTVNLTASPVNITANGTSISTIMVAVTDQNNNLVPDGTNVVFATNHGSLGSSNVTKQTSGGVATADLTSESSNETIIATVTATAGSVSAATAVFFIPVGGTEVAQSETETVSGNGTMTNSPTGGDVNIDAIGDHNITTAKYTGNPGGTPSFNATGDYYDVHLDSSANVTSLTIEFCPAAPGTVIYYWNGTSWQPCSDQSYSGGCIVVTITDSTFPSLSDLTGLVFGSGLPVIATIDIKPGSDPNSINLKDQGVLPVAILGSSVDVSTIDLSKPITLGGTVVTSRGPAKAPKLAVSFEDVDGDGSMDLIAFFSVQDLVTFGALDETTTELMLEAENTDGVPITGTDTVNVVPPDST